MFYFKNSPNFFQPRTQPSRVSSFPKRSVHFDKILSRKCLELTFFNVGRFSEVKSGNEQQVYNFNNFNKIYLYFHFNFTDTNEQLFFLKMISNNLNCGLFSDFWFAGWSCWTEFSGKMWLSSTLTFHLFHWWFVL